MSGAATILLVAHGAGDGSPANDAMRRLAKALAEQRPGSAVRTAFRLGTPRLEDEIATTARSDAAAIVVPIMTSDGYFMNSWVRPTVASVNELGRLSVAAPLGTDPELQRALASRAATAALAQGCREILVVGHGTERHADSGDTTRCVAEAIALRLPGHRVVRCFLDDEPRLEHVAAERGCEPCVVVPWLIGGGHHACDDIRARLGGRPATVLPALIDGDALLDAALRAMDSIEGRSPRRVLRLGTRASRLALVQAAMAVDALAAQGIASTIVSLDTAGDRDHGTPIEAFPTDGPFTDELELALAAGHVDAAVHSLKDLPLSDHPDTVIAAVLPRGDAGEALVTRDGACLADLPRHARIGTCSPRRRAQLQALRPDLLPVPVRGAVDDRLRQLDEGRYDALVLAVAGLERLGLAHRVTERLTAEQMLPEAGQGAIAITVRRCDEEAIALCGAADDPATRRAVEAERGFAALVERDGDSIAAAWATADGAVRLLARRIDGLQRRDVEVGAPSARLAAERAYEALEAAPCR